MNGKVASSNEFVPSIAQNSLIEDKLSRLSSTTFLKNLHLTGKNTTIAFIDTGINIEHEVFSRFNKTIPYHLVELNSTLDHTDSSTPSDFHHHGTHVVSIALGNSSNFRGVAPDASCVMVNVFENPDSFSTTRLHLVEGLSWLLNYSQSHPIDVVSISVGAPSSYGDLDMIATLVSNFTSRGIPIVASVGNAGLIGEGSVYTPASSPYAISVGAYDYSNLKRAATNGQGPGYNQSIKPDFLAPGVNELGADSLNINNYMVQTGASQAVPYVSGLIALLQQFLKENNLVLSVDMLKFFLDLAATPLELKDAFCPNYLTGWGIPQISPIIDFLIANQSQTLINISRTMVVSIDDTLTHSKIIPVFNSLPSKYRISLNSSDYAIAVVDLNPDQYGNPKILSQTDNPSKTTVDFEANHSYYLVLKGDRDAHDKNIMIRCEPLAIFGVLTIYDLLLVLSVGGCVLVGLWFVSRKKISNES